MIYLHKILPVFLLPVGFCVVLMVVGLVWRRLGICWLRMAILLAAGIPVVGDGLMLAAEGPQQPGIEEIGHAEAIVVLAGGLRQHTEGGIPQWSEQTVNRFESGVALLKAGKAPFLLLTKGAVPWERCALPIQDTFMARAKEMGVPEEKLKTTRVATNTAEEALAVAEAMQAEKAESRRE